MGYDRGDSFPFDFEPNGIPFGSTSKGKLLPRSYPIQCERKWKYSFLSVDVVTIWTCARIRLPNWVFGPKRCAMFCVIGPIVCIRSGWNVCILKWSHITIPDSTSLIIIWTWLRFRLCWKDICVCSIYFFFYCIKIENRRIENLFLYKHIHTEKRNVKIMQIQVILTFDHG